MTPLFTLGASALALFASGNIVAQQDMPTPPTDDETVTEDVVAPTTDEDTVYEDEAYEEPQGDANDDEGEVIAPSEDQLDKDGAVVPGDAATLPSYEIDSESEEGAEPVEEPEADPEL